MIQFGSFFTTSVSRHPHSITHAPADSNEKTQKGPAIAGPFDWIEVSLDAESRQAAAIGYINSVTRVSNTPLSMRMLWFTTGPLRSTASLDS